MDARIFPSVNMSRCNVSSCFHHLLHLETRGDECVPSVVPRTEWLSSSQAFPFQTGLPCRDRIFSLLLPGYVPLGLALANPSASSAPMALKFLPWPPTPSVGAEAASADRSSVPAERPRTTCGS